jgi:hypothetical protein
VSWETLPKTLFESQELASGAAKSGGRRVRGSFCILTPEMANSGGLANWLKLWRAGARTYGHTPEG